MGETKLTRRALLKRGALLGGAVSWATPVVQMVAIQPALAQPTSPDCVTYCLKWEVDQNTVDPVSGVWTNNWTGLGSAASMGNCLVCPPDATNDAPPGVVAGLTVTGDPETGFTVTFPNTCDLPIPGDPTPDEFYGQGAAASKCGAGPGSCAFLDAGDVQTDPADPNRRLLDFPVCPNGRGISHLELILRCCE